MKWLDITTRDEFKSATSRDRMPAGILRATFGPPDPDLAYVIRQQLGAGAFVTRTVRSVGKVGSLYYYAADLRFVSWHGPGCVWPVPDSDAYPHLYLDVRNTPHGTIGELVAFVRSLAGDLAQYRETVALWSSRAQDDQDAMQQRAEKWAGIKQVTIQDHLPDWWQPAAITERGGGHAGPNQSIGGAA